MGLFDGGDWIELPGTTETRGKGSENPEHELKALTRAYRFDGAAWYRREVAVPEAWRGKRVRLVLERTKYTRVWLDGTWVGENGILCTPQVYALGAVAPGRHVLTIMVDNRRRPVPGEMHQMSDNTQGNWNGILGRIALEAHDGVWIDAVRCVADHGARSASVVVRVGNEAGRAGRGTVRVSLVDDSKTLSSSECVCSWDGDGGECEVRLPLDEGVAWWDEFEPRLYDLVVTLEGEGVFDRFDARVGLREFRAAGSKFVVNGRTTFLRGKNDACVFPLTGHPPMDAAGWLGYFRICQDYGINYIRFHTWTPPEAAFAAADALGMYVQPELPFWGAYTEEIARALMPEGERILRCYGHHPSFVMFALGNECHGDRAVMQSMIAQFRAMDPTRLYAEGSNNFLSTPTLAEGDDFWVTVRVTGADGVIRNVRGSYCDWDTANGHVQIGPPNTMMDYDTATAEFSAPVVSHEIAQFTVYPDYSELANYTGVLRPRNLEHFRGVLAEAGMLEQAEDFCRASGALAALCYREDIEAALRTRHFGGFHLLDLQDFPGQGTALVGLLDAFMDSKGILTPEAWRQFCDRVVLLARFEKYAWTTAEEFVAKIQVAHYGEGAWAASVVDWSLADEEGGMVGKGSIETRALPQGDVHDLGEVRLALGEVRAPRRLTLCIGVGEARIETRYPLWVYPATVDVEAPAGVMVARSWDEARPVLEAGGRVLLLPQAEAPVARSVGGGFATDLWCYPMFHNEPGTMGILCDPGHPALALFPTEFHTNWQWFHVTKNSRPMILDEFPRGYRPIVQVIDNIERCHRLGLVFEAMVGPGRLLVCAADLPAIEGPEARQLLASLLAYAGSFEPEHLAEFEALDRLFAPKAPGG